MSLSILGVIFGGCDSLLYDNLEDCPQGVYVKFYSMTPCESDSIFIGSVPSLTVFAFDKKGTLVTFVTQKEVTLSREYEILMPVSNGSYSFTRLYPDSDIAILNSAAADVENGNVEAAIERMLKISGNAKVWNNLGVGYARKGNLEKAKEYLEKALSEGSAEAKHNIEELAKTNRYQ